MQVDIKKIIDLRMRLHRMAELAWNEHKTMAELEKFFNKYHPDKIIKFKPTGIAFVFDSGKTGDTIVFRAELDAVAVSEPEDIYNKSLTEGVSHKCGHDGHMAILTAVAEAISHDRPAKGKVIILFQPAEETLDGARIIMGQENFPKPDYIFALHNLPDYEPNTIVLRNGNMTAATNGVTIEFFGTASHAAFPQQPNKPTLAALNLLQFLSADITKYDYKDFVLSTPVYTQIGKPDFGLAPDYSKIMVTLRAYEYADLDRMIGYLQDKVKNNAIKYQIKYKITYSDDAPPVINNSKAVQIIEQSANELQLKIEKLQKPFIWAEDFGYYTLKYKGAFFGFGVGINQGLHSPYYDFPDNYILNAAKLFFTIYKKLNF